MGVQSYLPILLDAHNERVVGGRRMGRSEWCSGPPGTETEAGHQAAGPKPLPTLFLLSVVSWPELGWYHLAKSISWRFWLAQCRHQVNLHGWDHRKWAPSLASNFSYPKWPSGPAWTSMAVPQNVVLCCGALPSILLLPHTDVLSALPSSFPLPLLITGDHVITRWCGAEDSWWNPGGCSVCSPTPFQEREDAWRLCITNPF